MWQDHDNQICSQVNEESLGTESGVHFKMSPKPRPSGSPFARKKKDQLFRVDPFLSCGRWDLNPHDKEVTRSLVLLVCQFRHFRIPSPNNQWRLSYFIKFSRKSQHLFSGYPNRRSKPEPLRPKSRQLKPSIFMRLSLPKLPGYPKGLQQICSHRLRHL